ncbi:hypothetical protein C2E21_5410 [Chlorella sorokiniana]|uniref:Sulfotransferase n=1 Tax=Chlorella sorokiniana TaxID=3076 RepID=A0A2P6TN71_CHLSO|nr:hypothetical protein C2E21_5410 [Chlorella sorokiniana]|eukprot:PRW50784.1 hypothetical protein C2E21_5410 [Chlorella sorokiniana]
MSSPPGRGVGRRRSWPGAPLAAVMEDWHAEQRAEAVRRVRVGNRALALLAVAGIIACLIVLSSGSLLGGGKGGSLHRHRLESGRRMAAEVPVAQQHALAAGILVGTGQQQQLLMPKLSSGSSEDGEERAGGDGLTGAASQQQPGGDDEEAAAEEEEEEEEEEEAEEEAAEAVATEATVGSKRAGSGEKAGSEAAEQEAEEEADDKEDEAPAQQELSKPQGTASSNEAAGSKPAAAGKPKRPDVAEEGEGAAADGSNASDRSTRGATAGRKAGPGSKAGTAEPAEDDEEKQRQQRRREAAARASQVSLSADEDADAGTKSKAARVEPASSKAAAAVAAQAVPAATKGNTASAEQQAEEPAAAGPKSPYQLALERCNDLACLREAAKQERQPGQYLFPHALVIGWQKSAAAGLFGQLAQHPSVLAPQEQESEFFSEGCDYNPAACPHEEQQEYIQHMLRLQRALRQGLRKPVIEGSTRYAAEGPRMAQGLHEVFPWLKLVASLREPISRAVAVLASAQDEASQHCLAEGALFACLKDQLPALNYTAQLSAWLDAFPADQVMLLQYETLASPDQERVAAQLSSLHKFLGLEPTAAPAGGSLQLKETQPGARSWRIKTEEYHALVKLVRPDAKSISEIVAQHGFGDGKQWLKNWEKPD